MMASGTEVLVFLVVGCRKPNTLEDVVIAERISRNPDELARRCARGYYDRPETMKMLDSMAQMN